MTQNNRGSVLLFVLILLAILGFHVLLMQLNFSNLMQTFEWSAHSQRALLKVHSNAFQALNENDSSGIHCEEVAGIAGKTTLRRVICSETTSSEEYEAAKTQPLINGTLRDIPLFNYSGLFRNFEECAETEIITIPQVSDGAVLSRTNCNLSSGAPQSLILAHNLIYRGDSELRLENSHWDILGSIEIRNRLIAEGDVTIIAGGNVTLVDLECASNSRVLIVSATGAVQLHSFSGAPCLKVISKKDPIVPLNALKSHSLFPPELRLQVLGSYPAWEVEP